MSGILLFSLISNLKLSISSESTERAIMEQITLPEILVSGFIFWIIASPCRFSTVVSKSAWLGDSCWISLLRSSFSILVKEISTKSFTTLSIAGFFVCSRFSCRQIGHSFDLTVHWVRQSLQKVCRHLRETAYRNGYKTNKLVTNLTRRKYIYIPYSDEPFANGTF